MNVFVKHYERIKLGGLIALVLSLPYDLRISSVLLILIVALTLFKVFAVRKLDLRSIDGLPFVLLCYVILEVIGVAYTDKENMRDALSTLEKHQALVVIPLIFFDLSLKNAHKNKLLGAFVITCVVSSLICVVGSIQDSLSVYHQIFNDWMFSHDRFAEHIDMQPVYFAMYMSFSVLVVLNVLREKYAVLTGIKRAGLCMLLLYLSIIIVVLGARTIIVGLMLIVMLNMLLYARERKSYFALGLTVLTPVLFAGAILLQPTIRIRFMDMVKSNYSETNYGSYFARLKIWEPGMEVIKENFWFGVGTGDDQAELDKKFIKYNYAEAVGVYNMHNQYLQSLLNFGVPGLLVLLVMFYVQLRRGFLNTDLLYISFVMLFMTGCLTESMLSRNKGIIFFLVFSFIFYKVESFPGKGEDPKLSR